MRRPLRPFFSYFGSKFRIAGYYPPPVTPRIVEPFAGSAAYACRYPWLDVTLVEKNPKVAGVWDYLIRAKESEVLALPLVTPDTIIAELPIPQEARYMIGFWCIRGDSHPARKASVWMVQYGDRQTQFWGERARWRVAQQQRYIRHWRLICGAYTEAPDVDADWFVDPPYIDKGKHYRQFGSAHLDYTALGDWCLSRAGQVTVCENEGATWLPFERFRIAAGTNGKHRSGASAEAIWHRPLVMQQSLFA